MFPSDEPASLSKLKWMFEEQQRFFHFATWQLDIPQKLFYGSQAAFDIFGMNENGPVEDMAMVRLLYPDERERVRQAIREAIEKGVPSGMECRITRTDGEIRWTEWHFSTYFDERGEPAQVFGTIQDITEMKMAEAEHERLVGEIDAQRRQLQALMDAIPAGVFISDQDGKLLHINRYAKEIWGNSLPLPRDWTEYNQYKGRWAGTDQLLQAGEWPASRALTKGETVLGEAIDIERFDGFRGTILNCASPVKDECGNITGSIAINIDITKQSQTEAALRISEGNLRNLFAKSHIGVIISDFSGRVRHSNPAAEQILGYACGELVGVDFSRFTYADDLEIEMPLICELKDGKRDHYVTEKRYIRKNGEIIWVRVTGTMMQDANNGPQGIVLIEDINERKRNEEQIKRQNATLKTINRIHEQSLTCHSSDELLEACMEIIEEVTESPIVYIGEVKRARGEGEGLPCRRWCRMRCESGQIRSSSHFPDGSLIADIILTAKPVRLNEMSARRSRENAHISAFMGIPVKEKSRLVGVLAVANRPGGYTPALQELLESLAPAIILSLLKKRGEETALENEQLMRTIMESAADFLFVKDRDSRVVMINQAYGRTFGVEIGDVIGKNDYELYSDAELAREVIENDRHVMRTGKTLVCQEAALTADGYRTFQLSKVPWVDTRGRVMGILGIAHDVTELKTAKDSLEQMVASMQHSKETIEILYETTERLLNAQAPRGEITALCGKVMKFLDCHVFFNYLTEGSHEVMRLNACAGVSEQQNAALEFLPIGEAICGCVVRYQCRIVSECIQTSDDPRTELMKSMGIRAYACHPLMMDGKALGSLGFGTRSRDRFNDEELLLMKTVAESVAVAISRKQNEETLIRQAEELKTADRYKNAFLGTLSHELRNPLATISMGLSLLEATQDREQQEKTIEIMNRQITQLGNLVDDLLNLTRITQNKIVLKKERLELSSLACTVAEDYHPQFREKNIHLDCGVPHRAVYVEADPVRVKQIVGNVVMNALKFTDTGGAVRLSVSAQNGSALIQVKDTGRGIDPALLKIIFEPFMQADDTIDRKNGGLGLGLSIVKGIAELHGGSVSAVSAGHGKGSEFTICLPMAQ